MDEPAADASDQAESPEQDEDHENCPQHGDLSVERAASEWLPVTWFHPRHRPSQRQVMGKVTLTSSLQSDTMRGIGSPLIGILPE
jgi:hypothetical protein